jgi:hypothetical protein
MSDEVVPVTIVLCGQCLDGIGGECHTPGCAMWMKSAPDVPVRDNALAAEETVICCDCGTLAIPRCDRAGHGLVTLSELIDSYSRP